MSKILVTRKIFDEAIELLDRAELSYDHNSVDTSLTAVQIQSRGSGIEALICLLTDKIDAAIMDAIPTLKVIANVAVGYDNIDVNAATERGIIVTNTPGVLTECTADLAFSLLLVVARRIVEADPYMRGGHFKGWELFQPHLGVDVFGKTLGIVGMGRIGTAVARRGALGFGMSILYNDSAPKEDVEKELGVSFVSFEELLQQSDFVSIHIPLSEETRHLFTLQEFELMKPSAFIINTSRGPVIKEDDLAHALSQGLIAGAALDVFEHEPEINPELARLKERVVVVPHIGSATVETRQQMATTAVSNAVAVLQGKRPPNPVNPELLLGT